MHTVNLTDTVLRKVHKRYLSYFVDTGEMLVYSLIIVMLLLVFGLLVGQSILKPVVAC